VADVYQRVREIDKINRTRVRLRASLKADRQILALRKEAKDAVTNLKMPRLLAPQDQELLDELDKADGS